jgi:hypothetical protein
VGAREKFSSERVSWRRQAQEKDGRHQTRTKEGGRWRVTSKLINWVVSIQHGNAYRKKKDFPTTSIACEAVSFQAKKQLLNRSKEFGKQHTQKGKRWMRADELSSIPHTHTHIQQTNRQNSSSTFGENQFQS